MRAKTQKHVCNLKASFLLVSRFVLVMAASRFLGLFLVLCLIATTVFASPDGEGEPQDLGAGRRGKSSTIRRGGGFGGGAALSTSGFFSFQGNHEEYDEEGDEELGEAIAGPAPEGLGEALDAKLDLATRFSTEAKVAVKEIVEKAVSAASTKRLLRKHKSQLGETLKAAVEAKLGTQVPITKSIQKIIDDVADELSRTCAATALSAGRRGQRALSSNNTSFRDPGAPARWVLCCPLPSGVDSWCPLLDLLT